MPDRPDQHFPHGVAGWPWTAPVQPILPSHLPSGRPLPRISIVTPSFNQGSFIEETLLSVAHQGYPNLEHIVIDGGSTDGTCEILMRHAHHLTFWTSEPDNGQSHALNKGFARATGGLLTWLNADDMLAPGALASMALAFDPSSHTSEPAPDLVAGICQIYDRNGIISNHLTACTSGVLPLKALADPAQVKAGAFFYQPEVMFTRDLWTRAGGFIDESLHYAMDYDLWLRFAKVGARLKVIGRPIALFRVHPKQKTNQLVQAGVESSAIAAEADQARRQHASDLIPSTAKERTHVKQPRIVALNDIGFSYGAGIAHRRLVEAMRLGGLDVETLTLGHESEGAFAEAVSTFPSVEQTIRDTKPDLVLTGNIHALTRSVGVLARISATSPVVAVLHDLFLLTGRCAHPDTCTLYQTGCDETCPTSALYPRLHPAKIADAHTEKLSWMQSTTAPLLLAASSWTKAFAKTALPLEANARVAPLSLGFPTHIFRPRDRSEVRTRLGLPLEDQIVAFAAATVDDPNKGIDDLIAIFKTLARPGLTFLAIGRVSSPEALDIPGLRTVGLIQDEEEMADWLAASDIYITASRLETFGQTAVEAGLCGTPVVAYRTTGLTDAVLDGVSGLLVEPHRDALLQALTRLLDNESLRTRLSVWGRIALEARHSYANAYHSLHTAFLRDGLLSPQKHPIGIRFLPELARTWSFSVAPLALLTREATSAQHPGFIFRFARYAARIAFPHGAPDWVKLAGMRLLAVERRLRL